MLDNSETIEDMVSVSSTGLTVSPTKEYGQRANNMDLVNLSKTEKLIMESGNKELRNGG